MQINTTHIEVISCPNLGVQQLQQQKKKAAAAAPTAAQNQPREN